MTNVQHVRPLDDEHSPGAPAEDHHPSWVSREAYPFVSGFLGLVELALFWALGVGKYWLVVPLALVTSHLMHGSLIGFHEASHGMLRKNRRFNEFEGVFIGLLSFTSFSLYRAAHQTHHMHLGTARDEELWPFVDTQSPRWFRRLAAFLELFFGLFFTPSIFLRTFLRKGSPIRAKKVRRRIWAELALVVAFWTTLVTMVAVLGAWKYLLWMYVIPGFLAANLQSWRKYVEHVGLTGSTVRSATRSVVADTLMGKLVSFTLLHEPYHGVHHQRAGLPHAELPFHTADLQPRHEDEHAPFPSYWHAIMHLLGSLRDPMVGSQWEQKTAGLGLATATNARVRS